MSVRFRRKAEIREFHRGTYTGWCLLFPDGKEGSMSAMAIKKRVLRKDGVPALKGRDKAINKKPLRPAKDPKHDSEAIERAVYDGMQDLRTEKPK